MHGFIATISHLTPIPELKYNWKPVFDFQPVHIRRKFSDNYLCIEQFTSEKFLEDKLWIDNSDFFMVTEGLIINIDQLLKKYNTNDYEALITLMVNDKKCFFEDFRGNFAGIYVNKVNNCIYCFNNHTASKKLFYFSNKDYLIFSTDLFTLGQALNELNISKHPDVEACYLLLTSGFMQDDYTLIKEIKQIRAGEYALFDGKLNLNFYYHLKDIEVQENNEKNIIENLNILFKEVSELEFNFEKKRNFTPLTTLSGGLDSRMVALTAFNSGFRNQILLNFSEKGYADEFIASKIADDYKMKIIQIPLSPQGLTAIDEVVAVNDGLNIYTGISHVFEALKQIKELNIGIIHTGMIGDAVLGSFLSGKEVSKPHLTDGLNSKGLLSKAKPIIEKSMAKYPNEEIYKFYNRAFLGANTGFLYFGLLGESLSPFLYPEFLSYALSIPKRYNYKEGLYIKWMKTKNPEFAKYIWESIGGKPTTNKLIRLIYKYKRAVIKRLPIKSIWKNNMNPEQIWFDKNPEIKKFLDDYFESNIALIKNEIELQNDMKQLYKSGNITEKAQVITLLAAFKLHFT